MHIDHVILASADLSVTAQRWRDEYGIESVPGGEHPGWGTANRVVPAGSTYIEFVGVSNSTVAAQNPFGQWLMANTNGGDRLAGLAIATDDLDSICARLGLAASPGSRETTDGHTLTWRHAGMEAALTRLLPYFIAWDGPHESTKEGRDSGVQVLGIEEVRLGGDPKVISEWIGDEVDGLSLVGGDPGVAGLTLRTTDGSIDVS